MKIVLDTVRERDIDLLFINLLSSSKVIRDFLMQSLDLKDYKIKEIYHSIMNEHGESDIVLVCKNKKLVVSVHIENKIDASSQPSQFERYKLRCQEEMNLKRCNDYKICMLCTKKYHLNNSESKLYPYHIFYEDILELLIKNKSNNLYIEQFKKAIDKSNHKVFSKSEKMSLFWKEYFDYLDNFHSHWVNLRYKRIENLGPRSFWRDFQTSVPLIKIIYKANKGSVDIEFSGQADNYVNVLRFVSYNFGPLHLEKCGKSLAIKYPVKKIDFNKSFGEQTYIINEVLEQVVKCYFIVNQMKSLGIEMILIKQ